MIEIKCAAADAASTLCERVNAAADTVLEMTERDERLGFACMTYDGDNVTLMYLEAPDTALADALLRAALNTARAAGAKTAYIACDSLLIHMQQKGYLSDLCPTWVEIADFFAKSACKA